MRLCGIVPILEHIAEKHDLCELKKVIDKGCKSDSSDRAGQIIHEDKT